MLKKIAIVVAILIVALLGYAATRPDTFRVERATSINAPPEKIFVLINDLNRWGAWSPFEKKDPAMKRTLSGATNVTWAIHGPSPFLSKVIGIFCNMDKMIGKDFETGLASLKAAAEK
jgi:hypothetical protein